MINTHDCPYNEVHLNHNSHISGKEKNRDCKCANIGKDPEMKILKIQNPEKAQEKPVSCCEHNKTYSSEERLGHEMIESLPGANSSTKNQIAELFTIPRDKLPQSESHTGEELGSHPGKDDTPTMAQSNSILNGTAKALLRPQSPKNEKIHTYYIGKTQTGTESSHSCPVRPESYRISRPHTGKSCISTSSSKERLGHEMIPLTGANSSTKIAELITISRDKLPQSKSHTGEELENHHGEDDRPTIAQSNSVLNGTAKALLRPQNSKNDKIHTYYIGMTAHSYADDTPTMAQSNNLPLHPGKEPLSCLTGNGPGITGSESTKELYRAKLQSQTGNINIESNDPKLDKLIQATERLIQLESEGVEIIAPDGMSFPLGPKQTYKNFNKKFARGMRTESGGSLKDYHSWRKGLATLNRNQRLLDYKNKVSWLNIMLETDFIDIITAGDSQDVNVLIMKHFTKDMAVQILEHLAPEVLFNDDYRLISRQTLLADCVRTEVNDEGRMILITVMVNVLNRQYKWSSDREAFPVEPLLEIWNVITCDIRAGNDEYDARLTGLRLIDRYFESWKYASCIQHFDTLGRKPDTAENIKDRPKAKCSIKFKAEKNGNSCQTSMEQSNLFKMIPDMVVHNLVANNSGNSILKVASDKVVFKPGPPTKAKSRIDSPHITLKLLSEYAEIFQSTLSSMLKPNYSISAKKRDNSYSYFSIKRRRVNPQATFCNHKGTISLWNRTMAIYGYADQPLNYFHNYCEKLITTGVRWEEKRKRNQSRKSSHLAIMNQTSNTNTRKCKVYRCPKKFKCLMPIRTISTTVKQRRMAKLIANLNKMNSLLEQYRCQHTSDIWSGREPFDYELKKGAKADKTKNAAGQLAINSRRETWKRRKRKAYCN
jgi:hypothetical protein